MPEDDTYLATGPRVGIRLIERGDGERFTALARASVALHHPWMTLPTTDEAWETYIGRLADAPDRKGFVICERKTGEMAGCVNINNIVQGLFQCGAVGYAVFAPSAGRGYMTEGMGLVLRHAFGPLGLHRLEANIQPGNEPSLALVRRHGFRLEGFSPDFLFIDGAWRDHERWALTSEMLPPEPPR
ncbi:GNAT family N-acetyltransferase [Streptomyces sp. NPDC057654]|uniref:GNAT family N-acetyltransferase n=1 Tax=Streptomyces sp. NPDC057654 TaxID=3346196 RepID=UPI0036D0D7A2